MCAFLSFAPFLISLNKASRPGTAAGGGTGVAAEPALDEFPPNIGGGGAGGGGGPAILF